MYTQLKKIIFSKAFFIIATSIVAGLLFCIFLFLQSKQQNLKNDSYPVVEVPLQEVEKSPENFILNCVLRKIVVRDVSIQHLTGKLFGLCDYKVGNETQEVAILLGYVDKSKQTTFMFGERFGVFKVEFETNAFESLANQAGFVAGRKLVVILTRLGNPPEGQGVLRIQSLGDDIDALYKNSKDSFNTFAKTGLSKDLPDLGKIDGDPIVLPVSVI